MNQVSIIDMGTNTFQLFVPQAPYKLINAIEIKRPVRLGADGFINNLIGTEAKNRAMSILKEFQEISINQGVSTIYAFGTSAFRNSKKRYRLYQ